MICPLCVGYDAVFYHRDKIRSYYRCRSCELVFVPPSEWISRDAERARYDQHQNNPADYRYRRFLSQIAKPLIERVEQGSGGLDFGSGSGSALPALLREAGLQVSLFDPFYAPDESVWTESYSFVAASEVFEHLRTPKREIERLFNVLEPGGWLAVMTQWVGSYDDFIKWRYIRDPTHVAFYSSFTFEWIADRWTAELEFPTDNVAMLRKNTVAKSG